MTIEDSADSRRALSSNEMPRGVARKWRWLRHKVKHILGGLVNRHPYLWYAAWTLMPHFNFLLPHEKSYYAFRHVARKNDGLFLDVGANNGISARGFHRLIPHYRIFSIEANEAHRDALERVKRDITNFDFRIAAAGAEPTALTLYMAKFGKMSLHTGVSANLEYLTQTTRAAFHSWTWRYLSFVSFDTQVIRLDELDLAPDIIKVDVEGYDIEVLTGLQKTIAANRPVILVEFDDAIVGKLEVFCNENAYSMYCYDDLGDAFKHFTPGRENELEKVGASPMNLFLMPTEKVDGLPLASG